MNRLRPCLLLLCASILTTAAIAADEPLLLVSDVPDHGIVVSHVDLTDIARWCGIARVEPQWLSAKAADTGAPIPAQFVPDPDFDPVKQISGTIVLKLPLGFVGRLRLEFDHSQSNATTNWNGVVENQTARFHYDDKRMGGLPDRIEFLKTGKVFDNFAWNDRLHSSDNGGFNLRYDSDAEVQLLSLGPICTVVRTQAKYARGGKAPDSHPHAVYHWHYFRDLPLVFVTALIEQQDAKPWKEIHFLELNFPGNDFNNWIGGDPLEQGEFSGSQKSFSYGQWAALRDGINAIGMLRAGRMIFHDGRGKYGTYLHAHGDRAWTSWETKRLETSAWLWVGTDDDPGKTIPGFLDRLPSDSLVQITTSGLRNRIDTVRQDTAAHTRSPERQQFQWQSAMAEQLERQGRFADAFAIQDGRLPQDWTTVSSGDLRMTLENPREENNSGGLRLLSLYDARADHELLAGNPLPLFTMTIEHIATKQSLVLKADDGWGDIQIKEVAAGQTTQLRWQNPLVELPSAQTDANLPTPAVTVIANADHDSAHHSIRWTLNAKIAGSAWTIRRVVFPQLAVAEFPHGGQIFFPRGPGEVQQNLWKQAFRYQGVYPSGWLSMQFLAAYSETDSAGLYVACHDPLASTKDISVVSDPQQRSVVFTYDHPVPDAGKPNNTFSLSGSAVWHLLRGDWFDAASIYRDWVRSEAKWYPSLTENGREDTPLWMRELPAWALSGGFAKQCVASVKDFAKYLAVPVGFHWYSWHEIPFDNDYPHYFPTKEGFAEGVRELQQSGVFVMPYINGRLWDTRDKGLEDFQFTQVALPAVTKDEQGKPFTESYSSKETDGSRVSLGVMCPSTEIWKNKVAEIIGKLFNEYGLKGVYIDQIAAASPKLCNDSTHGHPLGGGHWWTAGYWDMLERIRRAKPQDRILTTECNAEPYIRWFDGYLTWHWQYDGQVPAFPAVYGGAIQMFGRAYRGGDSKNLALRMKSGQQLVFGEQIGWIYPSVVKEKENAEFLSRIVHLRWRLRRYFYAGEMARPPQLLGDVPTVEADWQWRDKWPVTTSAVLTGAWRLPREKKMVLLFVNVSDQPVSAKLHPAVHSLLRQAHTLSEVSVAAEPPIARNPPQPANSVTFPARGIVAWELQFAE